MTMNIELLSIIISSGAISTIVTFLVILLYVGKYREKVDRLDKENDKLNQQFLNISSKLSKIEGILEISRMVSPYVQSKSPLGLTEKGKALLIDSKGKDYIDLRKNEFLKEIKSKNPKTAYDVQEMSKLVIKSRTKCDEFNSLKDFAFRKGLSIDVILDVLGIYLRDIVLKELGFKDSDIEG